MRCPCRKKSESTAYADCCQPYHSGSSDAPTAEGVMRSRYAAFVLKDAAYLIRTWHPTTRPARIDFDKDQEWLLLKVLSARTNGDEATVEFQARSRIGGRSEVLHEISRFVREGGRWLYLDGRIA
jgi:SEC-C motif domain protein